uniref:Uncharacterized protein n=1 Tax=Toxoplasma gondii COUG TaxID=1074873 RepID=A0A2G8YC87_TOXGO|nr:hypothetical protein TGCOUG_217726 [Toxoplasma gondii COUG]
MYTFRFNAFFLTASFFSGPYARIPQPSPQEIPIGVIVLRVSACFPEEATIELRVAYSCESFCGRTADMGPIPQ